jgi:hypothetical protein
VNVPQTAEVLAKAALFDFRTVGENDVMAWWEVVSDLDYADSMAAVSRWYRDRSDRLMPSHLREAVALLQAERARAQRLAQAEALAESALLPRQEPVARPFGDLPAEMQAELAAASRGLLRRRVMAERFGSLPGHTETVSYCNSDGAFDSANWAGSDLGERRG